MEYLVGDKKYILHYQEIKEEYLKFCSMTDEEFLLNLSKALHLSCFICYLKEIPSYVCLADDGIIHELIHYLNGIKELPLYQLRNLFLEQLKLV
jgi:hypothetical protein